MSDPLTPPATAPAARAHSRPADTRPMRERGSSFALFAGSDPRALAWFEWERLYDAGLIGTPCADSPAAAPAAPAPPATAPAAAPALKRNLDRMLLALRGAR